MAPVYSVCIAAAEWRVCPPWIDDVESDTARGDPMHREGSLCVQCGAELQAGARFCSQCGRRVDTPAAESAAVPAGERRQVAILFADLSGYTRLSRAQDPEETHALLTRFFELVDGVIERSGGTIDKHIGDAVMGVFGAPVAYGNDVERALRAAVAIHDAMAGLSVDSGRKLGTHIGVASGEVVAAATGSTAHRNYTVTGDAVNLAARLTDLAAPGETVISDDVQRASATFAETASLGDVAIRGLPDAVRAAKLVALRPIVATAHELLGRNAERQRFASIVDRALADRRGAVALICADPGMGKSRLAEALMADALRKGAQCHSAAVLDFGVARGHDAIETLACHLLDVPHGDATQARQRAFERALAAGKADLDDAPYLADLLLLPQSGSSLYDAMDNEARRGGKLRAFVGLVERAARSRTVVLLVEDVHWASGWVLACLREVATLAERMPIVLALTTRRDGDPISGRWLAAIERFDLPPLAREDALALARAHLAASPDLAVRCVDRAQGNPLFLMQLLRSDSDDSAVPATIQSVVLARLDRLAPADKGAMQAAAVIGQRFPLALLRELVDDAHYVPTAPVERDLLRNDDQGTGDLQFTHALIRDGAYASLLHASRRALHEKAARWYATRDPTLHAEHLDRADDPRAAQAYLDAARAEASARRPEAALALVMRGRQLAAAAPVRFELSALAGDLNAELDQGNAAIAAFEQALDEAVSDRDRVRAWIGIAFARRLMSDVSRGLAALDAADRHAKGEDSVRARARIAYLRGSLHFAAGSAAECRRHHEQALALAHAAGDVECEAQALSGLADALYAQGRMRSAHSAFLRCLDLCARESLTRLALPNHCMVAILDVYLGDTGAALARFDRVRRTARDLRYRFAETMCEEAASWVLVFSGRFDEARDALARGLELARTVGARRFETILLVSLARLRMHDANLDDARRCLEDAWALSEEVGHRFAGPLVLAGLAAAARTEGERKAALENGERWLRDECVSHCYLGFHQAAIDIALDHGHWDEAERQATLLEDYLRDEPLPLTDFIVARGRALAAAGRGEADVSALLQCRERASALQLAGYLPSLERALAATA